MEKIEAVANYFIEKAKLEGIVLPPMKLLKLCYYSYGCYLAYTNKKLFSDTIEAWQYGPVIPSLYKQIKFYGTNSVINPLMNFELNDGKPYLKMPKLSSSKAEETLSIVWDTFSDFTSFELSDLTHHKDSPWDKVTSNYKRDALPNNLVIPDDVMISYFNEMVKT